MIVLQIRDQALEILQSINPDISDSVYLAAIDDVINFEEALADVSLTLVAAWCSGVFGTVSIVYRL